VILRRTIKLGIYGVLVTGVAFVTLFSASVYTFNVLTDETRIAELRFDQVSDHQFVAYLRTGDGCEEQRFDIYGDQWRIDAEFLKWKYWATLLGLDAHYRLDRIEGRYVSAEDQNSRETLAYDLAPESTIDVVGLAEGLGRLNFLTDATYGSSTYQTIDTARMHYVYRTQTGIITRSEPRPPAPRPGEGLELEVSRACGGGPSIWETVTRSVDSAVRGLL
jgi:hypothetical protein